MTSRKISTVVALLAGATVLGAPAIAQGSKVSSPVELARAADRLRPGEWVWAPSVAPGGPLLIYVDLSTQRATVYRNGVRIAVSTISSGKPGHETPVGVFTILQKDADHRSSIYNSAPMPFQQRLTWDGVALHAGGLPGYPESHGCVHLPYSFAQALFGITSLGATVVVMGDAASHVTSTRASLLAPVDAAGRPISPAPLTSQNYSWRPERAPTGPMTIIVSKADRQVVVLRNGVEIGRSAALINDPDPGSHVITLTTDGRGKPRWIYVGMPGHEAESGRELEAETVDRLRLPNAFYRAVRAELRPGTTILITQSSVGGQVGTPLTILDAVRPDP